MVCPHEQGEGQFFAILCGRLSWTAPYCIFCNDCMLFLICFSIYNQVAVRLEDILMVALCSFLLSFI